LTGQANGRWENAGESLFFVAHSEKSASLTTVERESGGESDLYGDRPIQKRETRSQKNTHTMKHTLRSHLTGRFIAKRSTSAELVEEHNRTTRKRRLWDWMDAIGMAILFWMAGFTLVWAIAVVLGVAK
jgi:hypothetical protein